MKKAKPDPKGIRQEANTTVLRVWCDGRDSGIQTDREPSELDWFFDIYIQGSNTTFFRVKSETRVSVIIISHGP